MAYVLLAVGVTHVQPSTGALERQPAPGKPMQPFGGIAARTSLISSAPPSAFLHLQPQVVVDSNSNLLLGTEVAFGGLDGSVTEQ